MRLDEDDDEYGEEPPPDRPLTPNEQKLQRWVDLLAAMLVRHRHATFEELARDVPGYDVAQAQPESVKRTFERDKEELRRFGIPIDTVPDADGEPIGYRLDRRSFYLPFLALTENERAEVSGPTPRAEGYRTLETLEFEPDELDAIIAAARRVRALGDPVVAREADSAIRKLALDLPLGAGLHGGGDTHVTIVPPRAQPESTVFERLGDALTRRKTVTFDYHTIERDDRMRRTVEPYGLFFVSAHWYLAGRDVGRDGLRNFRLSRITNVEVNKKRALSVDYEIPVDFSLQEHARSRESWEIGEGDAMEAVVEFVAGSGAAVAAASLGEPLPASRTQRKFVVRRPETFARWLLSFGGEARVVAPPALCAEVVRIASDTLNVYAEDGAREARAIDEEDRSHE